MSIQTKRPKKKFQQSRNMGGIKFISALRAFATRTTQSRFLRLFFFTHLCRFTRKLWKEKPRWCLVSLIIHDISLLCYLMLILVKCAHCLRRDVNSPWKKKPKERSDPDYRQSFASISFHAIHTSLCPFQRPMCLLHIQRPCAHPASEESLDGIFASPLLRGTVISFTIRLVNVSNFWNKRIVGIWVCEHGTDG